MRRAQRLFQIIQILRGGRGPHTAQRLADQVETSTRTVYRDIAALVAERVPIRGEAGVGYILEDGFDFPPLMLTADEVEALVLGVQWVSTRADPVLAKAAGELKAKIASAMPDPLRTIMLTPAVGMAAANQAVLDTVDVTYLRKAIHQRRKVQIDYRDGARWQPRAVSSGPSQSVTSRAAGSFAPGVSFAAIFAISEQIGFYALKCLLSYALKIQCCYVSVGEKCSRAKICRTESSGLTEAAFDTYGVIPDAARAVRRLVDRTCGRHYL